jgi:hypothetical protein
LDEGLSGWLGFGRGGMGWHSSALDLCVDGSDGLAGSIRGKEIPEL